MSNMLRFEFRKMFRGKALWICSGVVLLIVGISLGTIIAFQDMITESMNAAESSGGVYVSIADTFQYSGKYFLSSALSNITTILAVFVPIFVTHDFSHGILKTVVSRGCRRTNILASKAVAVLVAALIFSAVAMVSSVAIGTAKWGFGGSVDWRFFANLLTQILIIFTMACFYFSISMLIRKTGGSIAVCVVSMTVLSLIFTLIEVLADNDKISHFHLETMLSKLSMIAPDSGLMLRYAVTCVAYLAVMAVLNTLFFRRIDIG